MDPHPNIHIQEKYTTWLDDYKSLLKTLLQIKGCAGKVPPHQRESDYQGKIWFIPHHGLYHSHKPGKIHVLFDCSMRYKGKCLNDLPRRGSDPTNSLLDVLTRFHQERVAVMVDIEQCLIRTECQTLTALFFAFCGGLMGVYHVQ